MFNEGDRVVIKKSGLIGTIETDLSFISGYPVYIVRLEDNTIRKVTRSDIEIVQDEPKEKSVTLTLSEFRTIYNRATDPEKFTDKISSDSNLILSIASAFIGNELEAELFGEND